MPQLHKPFRVTGTSDTSQGLDPRRRRALYRASHRGTKEMDFIFGRFAEAEIAGLTETELDLLERLIEAPDTDLYEWVTGRAEAPPEYDTQMLHRLRAFHAQPGAR
jgi:antitoxin CptB